MRRRCVNSATLALQRAVERPFPRDSLSMGDYGGGGYGGGGGGGYGGGGGGGGGGNVRPGDWECPQCRNNVRAPPLAQPGRTACVTQAKRACPAGRALLGLACRNSCAWLSH